MKIYHKKRCFALKNTENKKQNNNPNNVVLPERYAKKNDRIFLYSENKKDFETKKGDTFI